MKNVQLFEEFVNNLSSNPLTEADAAAAEVWPDVPPFQANVQGSDGKFTKQTITNPAYWADLDTDFVNAGGLGILEKDLPKEYAAYKNEWDNAPYTNAWIDNYTDALVDYCDDKEDKAAEELTYRLIYGTDAWKKKYHPQGVKAGAKGLLKNEKPEEVDKYSKPPLKNFVFLKKGTGSNPSKWVPFVDCLRAAYNEDESFESFGSAMKKTNPDFYKAIVDCYKYWMDNVNKAGIKNVNPMAGKPKKKPTA